MGWELDHFHQIRRDVAAGEHHPVALEDLGVFVVELEAMAVPFADVELAIRFGGQRPRREPARVRTEPHRAAHDLEVTLILHEIDDRMRRLRLDLARVGEL